MLKTELSSKYVITINTVAVLVVVYRYAIIDWTRTDIQRMHYMTCKILAIGIEHQRNYIKNCTSSKRP